MGICISNPIGRKNNLLFPPEILEKILENLSTRDKIVARQVCHDWFLHINTTEIEENAALVFEDSDESLRDIVESPMELIWSQYCLKKIDLTRSSLSFWSNYGDIVTHLTLFECSIIPRDDRFYLGCPNLVHLALKACDKYFMMGGKYVHVHELLHLKSLKSLDLSDNKYLTDYILFSILLKVFALESLNLSSCPIVFMNSVHKRFYPNNTDTFQPQYSHDILSFKMLNRGFLSTAQGSQMKELILESTRFDGRAIQMITDTDQYNWQSLRLNKCPELKPRELVEFLVHQKKITRLEIERSKITNGLLEALDLSILEHLDLKECADLTSSDFLQKCPNLRYLDITTCAALRLKSEDLTVMKKLEVFKMQSIVPFYLLLSAENALLSSILCESFPKLKALTKLDLGLCGSAVTDEVVQIIIKELVQLKHLDIAKSTVTDRGLAGTEIDEFDPRMTHRAIEIKRAAVLQRLKDHTPGCCLSRLSDLRTLNLSSCEGLTEATWKFALKLPNLEILNLSYCSQISTIGVLRIILHCKNIETLNLAKCGLHITGDETVILQVRENLPRLKNFILM